MVRRVETEIDPADRDERLGEAIEAYLELAENGHPPDPSHFVDQYPDLGDDLRAALDGLELVQGLVGSTSGPGPGHGLESGRRVAGYKIVRELGRGGMGIVYEAVHVGLDRPVALKVLGTSAAPDSSGRRRFLNEARTAAALHHTHIVPVFDVGQVGGLCYYAMQRIEGSGLDRVIKHLRRDRPVAAGSTVPQGGKTAIPNAETTALGLSNLSNGANGSTASWGASLPDQTRSYAKGLGRPSRLTDCDDEPPPFVPPRGASYYRWVASVGKEAAEALAHAHERGVIHRDVKPSNLLVDARGVIWMADFGLARRLADPSQTQVDSLLGTPRYMSPEQSKTGPIDGRSDVYSLGATLYEMLTLRPPFDGKTAAELIEQIAGREPAHPRQFDRRIPLDLETIILKALAKRPVDRYTTAQEFADDLNRFLCHEPVKARRITPIGRAWRVARRHPSLTIVSTVAILAVIGAWTTAYYRVVLERDDAIEARKDAQNSALKTELANQATRAALRTQALQQATVQRLSGGANRRTTGLDLLKQAASLEPDAIQTGLLRDEAMALLSLRDVVAKKSLLVERTSGLVALDENRLGLLAESEDGPTFRIWDVTKGEPVSPLQDVAEVDRPRGQEPGEGRPEGDRDRRPRGTPRGFGGGPWSRAARMVVIGPQVAVVWPNGKGVRLFDTETGSVVGNLPLAGHQILGLFAVPNGKRLITVELSRPINEEIAIPNGFGDRGNRAAPRFPEFLVNLWNPESAAAPIATLASSASKPASPSPANPPNAAGPPSGAPQIPVPLVAISPTGQTIAVGWRHDPQITLYNRDGKKLDTIDTQISVESMALGPNDVLAATGNGGVQVWDRQAKTPHVMLTPHHSVITHLRFSPDSRALLAVAGWGSGVELWDLTTSTAAPMAVLPTSEWLSDMAFTPAGRSLVIAQGDTVAVWSVMDPAGQVRIAAPSKRGNGLDFGPNGRLVISSRDEGPRYWKPGDCTFSGGPGPAISPSTIAYDSKERLISIDDTRLLWLNAKTGATEARINLPPIEGEGLWSRVNPQIGRSIAQTPEADFLAFTRGNEVLAWSADAPNRIRKIELHELEIRGPRQGQPLGPRGGGGGPQAWLNLAVSPNADRIYGLTSRQEFRAYELDSPRTGSVAQRLLWKLNDDGKFFAMALSPDGSRLALAERGGRVVLVSTRNGHVLNELYPPESDGDQQGFSLAFSPDQTQLAIGSREYVRVWSIPSNGRPAPLVKLPGHRGVVGILAYDADGKHLASGDEKLVKVWDLKRIQQEMAKLGLGW